MFTWEHPMLGLIVAIPERLRPKKVWAHFCAADERWEHLCGEHARSLLAEVERAAGLARASQPVLPRLEASRWAAARATLQRAHDLAYGPAYFGELASPRTYWSPGMDRRHRHSAATPRGVFIVVQLDTPSWVVTAYRPHPPLRDVEWEEADYAKYARGKVDREIAMASEFRIRMVEDDLRRAVATPLSSVRQSWGLVLAVAYGRLFATLELVREPLADAERILAAMPEELRQQLAASLDWSGLLDRFASGLKAEQSEELEAALDDAEQALLVGFTVGEVQASEAFCQQAIDLLEWVDPGWVHLGATGAARARLFDADTLPARLWTAMADSIVVGALESGATFAHPAVMSAERGRPTAVGAAWMQRLAEFVGRGSEAAKAWVETNLAPAVVLAPVPMMGSGGDTAALEVQAKMVDEYPFVRAFIVAHEAPEGADVTEAFREDGLLWELETSEDGVLFVLLAGDAPMPGESLAQALAGAERRSDVVAAARWLSPPR
jgi:hypothetical protein